MNLSFFFEIALPDSIISRAIAGATAPGDKCHVEVLTPDGYYSAHFTKGVRFKDELDGIDDRSRWLRVDTPYMVTEDAMSAARATIGWEYDSEMAFMSALGRARRRQGKGFCSERCSWLAELCGMPALGVVPSPNLFEHLLMASLGKPMKVSSAAPVNVDALAAYYEAMRGIEARHTGKTGGFFGNIGGQLDRTTLMLDRTEKMLDRSDMALERLEALSRGLSNLFVPHVESAPRDTRWHEFSHTLIQARGACARCGNTRIEQLGGHHVLPVHERPELELDEGNIEIVCFTGALACHFNNHLGDWRKYDPDARRHNAEFLALVKEHRQ
jgi:hypothetical protein